MTDWGNAQRKAAMTAKWSVTMTKVRIRKTIARTRWQLVTFCGVRGGESVGIVDLLAIRKNHRPIGNRFARGDLFDIVLIQVKGGSAPYPSSAEVVRLRQVASIYKARAVLLARWNKGKQVEFFSLRKKTRNPSTPAAYWSPLEDLSLLFR